MLQVFGKRSQFLNVQLRRLCYLRRMERYFDVASDVPRKTVEASSNAMPRSGRSARDGAPGAGLFSGDGFSGNGFSGSGNEALSSLTAAAGRVTFLNSGPEKSNRARSQKSAIVRLRQVPKTGSGYALTGRASTALAGFAVSARVGMPDRAGTSRQHSARDHRLRHCRQHVPCSMLSGSQTGLLRA